MNQHTEHYLNLLATISGIIAFLWIGKEGLKGILAAGKELASTPHKGRPFWNLLSLIFPYLLFFAAAIYLSVLERRINVKNHVIKTIQAGDQTPVSIKPMVELVSTNRQFKVSIHGSIFGPELRSIDDFYGREHPPKVYALVSEGSVPLYKRDLVWVQVSEAGILNPNSGDYLVRASLGGTGDDAWKDGDVFIVRIYIPENQNLNFTNAWIYDNVESLPKPLFTSEPLYIRCKKTAM